VPLSTPGRSGPVAVAGSILPHARSGYVRSPGRTSTYVRTYVRPYVATEGRQSAAMVAEVPRRRRCNLTPRQPPTIIHVVR
jgi:hypothetical protein